jgi:hypothetical protein
MCYMIGAVQHARPIATIMWRLLNKRCCCSRSVDKWKLKSAKGGHRVLH